MEDITSGEVDIEVSECCFASIYTGNTLRKIIYFGLDGPNVIVIKEPSYDDDDKDNNVIRLSDYVLAKYRYNAKCY